MTVDDVYKYFGTGTAASAAIGHSRMAFTNWRNWGYIPYPTQLMFEKATQGALVASLEHAKQRKKRKDACR